MPEMRPGLRLKSVVCTGEAMVVKAIDVTLTCGGVPMLTMDEASDSDPKGDPKGDPKADPDHMFDCLIGKRYVNADGTLEVLCVKAGDGSFGYDGEMLMGKETKKLPSSD